jgi:hypothetical protein
MTIDKIDMQKEKFMIYRRDAKKGEATYSVTKRGTFLLFAAFFLKNVRGIQEKVVSLHERRAKGYG